MKYGTIHDFVLLNALRELPTTKAALRQPEAPVHAGASGLGLNDGRGRV
jgi:hypothetical protein